MPTYDYECKKCEQVFEVFQSMTEQPLTTCELCGGQVKRLIGGGAGIIFKGSGFYVTDNKASSDASQKKSSQTETGNQSDSSKTEKKPSEPSKTEPSKKSGAKKTAV